MKRLKNKQTRKLPIDPPFLKDRVTRTIIQKAVQGKKSDESVSMLKKAIGEASEKAGWATGKRDEALSPEERQHYEDRAYSGRSVKEELFPHLEKHQHGSAQSRRAKNSRPNALSSLVEAFLCHHPEAPEREVRDYLESCAPGEVIFSVTDDVIEWAEKDGPAKTTQISALRGVISRARSRLGVMSRTRRKIT